MLHRVLLNQHLLTLLCRSMKLELLPYIAFQLDPPSYSIHRRYAFRYIFAMAFPKEETLQCRLGNFLTNMLQ